MFAYITKSALSIAGPCREDCLVDQDATAFAGAFVALSRKLLDLLSCGAEHWLRVVIDLGAAAGKCSEEEE